MRLLLAWTVILSSLPFLLAAPAEAQPPYHHDPAAIVRLECDLDASNAVIGTADKIGPDTYITAAHVILRGVCQVGGVGIQLTLVDLQHDFAMFTGPQSSAVLPFSCGGFTPGSIYLARGYMGGGFDDAAMPWMATEIRDGPEASLIGDSIPGMSGGPVMDRRGRIVGIVNQRWPSRSLPLSETALCRRIEA